MYEPRTKSELRELILDNNISLADIDTSQITDMSSLFKDSGRMDFSGIENWSVSNVTNMAFMFFGCTDFNSDITNWDVRNVADMSFMFYDCKNFNQDIPYWNIHSAWTLSRMLCGCDSFEYDLSNWDLTWVIHTENWLPEPEYLL